MWFVVVAHSQVTWDLSWRIWRTVQGGWGVGSKSTFNRTTGQKRTRLAHQEKRVKVPEQRMSGG